jgi:carboxymethylenebutenolidase
MTHPNDISLPRREFMSTVLAAGFALAVQPVMAQTTVHTDTVGLVVGEVKIPVKDGEMPAYSARPAGAGPFPTVLVVQEIFGVHEYIRDVCRRLAHMGYLAVAPELYARQGDVSKMKNIQDILSGVVAKVSDEQVLADLDACVAWAAAHSGDTARLGITGFCWGGRITWLYAARNPKLKAAVAWYGRLDGEVNERTPKYPLDLAANISVPVLGLYGGQDQNIPIEDVEQMRSLLAKGSSHSLLHVYPEAPHAFHADYRPTYRKDAAEDGWWRLTAWFKEHGM